MENFSRSLSRSLSKSVSSSVDANKVWRRTTHDGFDGAKSMKSIRLGEYNDGRFGRVKKMFNFNSTETHSLRKEGVTLRKQHCFRKASEDSPQHLPKTKTSEEYTLTKTVADYLLWYKGADNRHADLTTTKITYRESDTTPYFYSAALNAKYHLKP
ncbi:hypothetical protein E3N88_30038 [Mikania micrantha]|uniref:Uncharacterized protein n=1 Tax=Mikania micrantha TaxID=192012 RepID=A0A5N6MKG5_9ASTR|nr:hypothetical protein E3N88_30038 [Mikania micrantha]